MATFSPKARSARSRRGARPKTTRSAFYWRILPHLDAFRTRREAAPVRQVRFHPAQQLPELASGRIAEIDPALVEDTSKRFGELKQAVDKADSARVGELLKVAV